MFSHDPLLVSLLFISMSFLNTHMNVYTYSYYQFHLCFCTVNMHYLQIGNTKIIMCHEHNLNTYLFIHHVFLKMYTCILDSGCVI